MQVHTFYEAVGYMIGSHTDENIQKDAIEKYMALPNRIWDVIIDQAANVSYCSFNNFVYNRDIARGILKG